MMQATSATGTAVHWNTDDLPLADKFDAWRDMLCQSHLPWSVDRPTTDKTFNANIQMHSFNGYRLIKCICDPLVGYRGMQEFANTDDAYLSVLYIKRGRENLRIDYQDIELQAGQLILWDSTRKMHFNVPERLEKVTLMLPERSLTSVFAHAHDYAGIPLSATTGMGAVFANHLLQLEQQMPKIGAETGTALMRPTMDMLAALLSSKTSLSPATLKFVMLRRIKQFIVHNLGNEQLGPAMIAEAHQISLRYLHLLFEDVGTSVSQWIRQRRLERSKDDILSAGISKLSIAEVAYRWGFSDPSHFSKVFKREYGVSPRGMLNAQRLHSGEALQ
ncbi:helix-turn-helix domain-containing protein [Spongiibacter nanhainus]|uniref:Helix-turn-helix domain-containing protein n=1 Tax=Spongiibacter nanhainus TaxID=2794344 RepID=A0A7T4QZG2_9GAMM|nr:helix-turn-helix domain-containing protein [Spongiibacter nanhainus]QQD17565.1 helix-turn-helix domain-containing protein [Spongiibacter nanhainus]